MPEELKLSAWLELASINIDTAAELSGLSASQIRYLESLIDHDPLGRMGRHRRYTLTDMPLLLRAGQLFAAGRRPNEIAEELLTFEPDAAIGEVETMRVTAAVLPRCILAVKALIELAELMELHQPAQAARDLLAELEKISPLSKS